MTGVRLTDVEPFALVKRIVSMQSELLIQEAPIHKSTFRRMGLDRVVSDLPRYDRAIRLHPGYDEMTASMVDAVTSVITGKKRILNVLELGPGTGTFTERLIEGLRPHGIKLRLTFVEPDEQAAAFTSEKVKALNAGNVELNRESYADLLDLDKGKFDVIVGSFAFHHISDKNKLASLERMRRLLGSGGLAVFGEEFVKHYENALERRHALAEYHAHVINRMLELGQSPSSNGERDMALIETLALVNGLENFDEAKISLSEFKALAEKAGFSVARQTKFFPSDSLERGVYTVVLK